MTDFGQPVVIEIPATPLATRLIGPWVSCLLELAYGEDVAARLAGSIELALVELATNISTHAYGDTENGRIRLEARAVATSLSVTVVDWGPEFDPDDIAEPEDVQVHGYGLMIIRQLADDFCSSRINDQNHWRLRFDTRDAGDA
ncbi:MAG: ATP-binding protein [Actinomycetota bacterium]